MKSIENKIVIDHGDRIAMSIFLAQEEPVLFYRYPGYYDVSSPEYMGQLVYGEIAILNFLAAHGLDENFEPIAARE